MPTEAEDRVLDAALAHVPFDGWSATTLEAAARDAGMPVEQARALFPRGAVDMALAYHRQGDARMVERLRAMQLDDLKFREKVAAAVRFRIEAADREIVRRSSTLFALPQHAGDGAKALWETADRIWSTLGDPSDDINWYTKRATLSGVFGATVLFWLGDSSLEDQDTWAFLDRRIEDVMQIEKAKGAAQSNPVLRNLLAGPNWLAARVKPPRRGSRVDLPGSWNR